MRSAAWRAWRLIVSRYSCCLGWSGRRVSVAAAYAHGGRVSVEGRGQISREPDDRRPPLPAPRSVPLTERPEGLADLDRLDAVFRALAHPTRRQILTVLRARGGTMTSGQLADRFDCAWPTTTRHLKVLADAGLVAVTRSGRQRIYSLDGELLHRVAGGWIDRFGPGAG